VVLVAINAFVIGRVFVSFTFPVLFFINVRIVRSFLLEEQKCVKAVLLEKQRQKTESIKKTKPKKSTPSKTKKL
jgi:hypothetical protein